MKKKVFLKVFLVILLSLFLINSVRAEIMNVPVNIDNSATLYVSNEDNANIGADTYDEARNSEEANFLTRSNFIVGQYKKDEKYFVYRSFLDFDLSEIPENSEINSVKLYLKATPYEHPGLEDKFYIRFIVSAHDAKLNTNQFGMFAGWCDYGEYPLKVSEMCENGEHPFNYYIFLEDEFHFYDFTAPWSTSALESGEWESFKFYDERVEDHIQRLLGKNSVRILLISENDIKEKIPENGEFVAFESKGEFVPYLEIDYGPASDEDDEDEDDEDNGGGSSSGDDDSDDDDNDDKKDRRRAAYEWIFEGEVEEEEEISEDRVLISFVGVEEKEEIREEKFPFSLLLGVIILFLGAIFLFKKLK